MSISAVYIASGSSACQKLPRSVFVECLSEHSELFSSGSSNQTTALFIVLPDLKADGVHSAYFFPQEHKKQAKRVHGDVGLIRE